MIFPARVPTSGLAAQKRGNIVYERLVEHFSRRLMNISKNRMQGNKLEKRPPLPPRLLINPFSPVEEEDSFKESIQHDHIVADDHLVACVRLLFPPRRSPTRVE